MCKHEWQETGFPSRTLPRASQSLKQLVNFLQYILASSNPQINMMQKKTGLIRPENILPLPQGQFSCSCTHSIGFWLWTGVIMGTHLHRTIIKIVDTGTFYHQRALDALHAVDSLWFAPPQTNVGRFSKMQLRITLQALLFQQFGPCQIALRSLFLPISPEPIH